MIQHTQLAVRPPRIVPELSRTLLLQHGPANLPDAQTASDRFVRGEPAQQRKKHANKAFVKFGHAGALPADGKWGRDWRHEQQVRASQHGAVQGELAQRVQAAETHDAIANWENKSFMLALGIVARRLFGASSSASGSYRGLDLARDIQPVVKALIDKFQQENLDLNDADQRAKLVYATYVGLCITEAKRLGNLRPTNYRFNTTNCPDFLPTLGMDLSRVLTDLQQMDPVDDAFDAAISLFEKINKRNENPKFHKRNTEYSNVLRAIFYQGGAVEWNKSIKTELKQLTAEAIAQPTEGYWDRIKKNKAYMAILAIMMLGSVSTGISQFSQVTDNLLGIPFQLDNVGVDTAVQLFHKIKADPYIFQAIINDGSPIIDDLRHIITGHIPDSSLAVPSDFGTNILAPVGGVRVLDETGKIDLPIAYRVENGTPSLVEIARATSLALMRPDVYGPNGYEEVARRDRLTEENIAKAIIGLNLEREGADIILAKGIDSELKPGDTILYPNLTLLENNREKFVQSLVMGLMLYETFSGGFGHPFEDTTLTRNVDSSVAQLAANQAYNPRAVNPWILIGANPQAGLTDPASIVNAGDNVFIPGNSYSRMSAGLTLLTDPNILPPSAQISPETAKALWETYLFKPEAEINAILKNYEFRTTNRAAVQSVVKSPPLVDLLLTQVVPMTVSQVDNIVQSAEGRAVSREFGSSEALTKFLMDNVFRSPAEIAQLQASSSPAAFNLLNRAISQTDQQISALVAGYDFNSPNGRAILQDWNSRENVEKFLSIHRAGFVDRKGLQDLPELQWWSALAEATKEWTGYRAPTAMEIAKLKDKDVQGTLYSVNLYHKARLQGFGALTDQEQIDLISISNPLYKQVIKDGIKALTDPQKDQLSTMINPWTYRKLAAIGFNKLAWNLDEQRDLAVALNNLYLQGLGYSLEDTSHVVTLSTTQYRDLPRIVLKITQQHQLDRMLTDAVGSSINDLQDLAAQRAIANAEIANGNRSLSMDEIRTITLAQKSKFSPELTQALRGVVVQHIKDALSPEALAAFGPTFPRLTRAQLEALNLTSEDLNKILREVDEKRQGFQVMSDQDLRLLGLTASQIQGKLTAEELAYLRSVKPGNDKDAPPLYLTPEDIITSFNILDLYNKPYTGVHNPSKLQLLLNTELRLQLRSTVDQIARAHYKDYALADDWAKERMRQAIIGANPVLLGISPHENFRGEVLGVIIPKGEEAFKAALEAYDHMVYQLSGAVPSDIPAAPEATVAPPAITDAAPAAWVSQIPAPISSMDKAPTGVATNARFVQFENVNHPVPAVRAELSAFWEWARANGVTIKFGTAAETKGLPALAVGKQVIIMQDAVNSGNPNQVTDFATRNFKDPAALRTFYHHFLRSVVQAGIEGDSKLEWRTANAIAEYLTSLQWDTKGSGQADYRLGPAALARAFNTPFVQGVDLPDRANNIEAALSSNTGMKNILNHLKGALKTDDLTSLDPNVTVVIGDRPLNSDYRSMAALIPPQYQKQFYETRGSIDQHRQLAMEVQAATGVPWDVVLAVWFREHRFGYGEHLNDGPFQLYSIRVRDDGSERPMEERRAMARRLLEKYATGLTPAQIDAFMKGDPVKSWPAAAYLFGAYIQDKMGGRLTPDASDEMIKEALWRFNGVAYGAAENSPYVYNGANSQKAGLRIRGYLDDGSYINRIDTTIGVFPYLTMLRAVEMNEASGPARAGDSMQVIAPPVVIEQAATAPATPGPQPPTTVAPPTVTAPTAPTAPTTPAQPTVRTLASQAPVLASGSLLGQIGVENIQPGVTEINQYSGRYRSINIDDGCGPRALVGVLRAINPQYTDLEKAIAFVQEMVTTNQTEGRDWWAPGGFGGAAAMNSAVDKLASMVGGHVVQVAVDWNDPAFLERVNRSHAAGIPVVYDTVDHYYVSYAGPAGGEMDWGDSAEVFLSANHQSKFTLEELKELGYGVPKTAFFIEGINTKPIDGTSEIPGMAEPLRKMVTSLQTHLTDHPNGDDRTANWYAFQKFSPSASLATHNTVKGALQAGTAFIGLNAAQDATMIREVFKADPNKDWGYNFINWAFRQGLPQGATQVPWARLGNSYEAIHQFGVQTQGYHEIPQGLVFDGTEFLPKVGSVMLVDYNKDGEADYGNILLDIKYEQYPNGKVRVLSFTTLNGNFAVKHEGGQWVSSVADAEWALDSPGKTNAGYFMGWTDMDHSLGVTLGIPGNKASAPEQYQRIGEPLPAPRIRGLDVTVPGPAFVPDDTAQPTIPVVEIQPPPPPPAPVVPTQPAQPTVAVPQAVGPRFFTTTNLDLKTIPPIYWSANLNHCLPNAVYKVTQYLGLNISPDVIEAEAKRLDVDNDLSTGTGTAYDSYHDVMAALGVTVETQRNADKPIDIYSLEMQNKIKSNLLEGRAIAIIMEVKPGQQMSHIFLLQGYNPRTNKINFGDLLTAYGYSDNAELTLEEFRELMQKSTNLSDQVASISFLPVVEPPPVLDQPFTTPRDDTKNYVRQLLTDSGYYTFIYNRQPPQNLEEVVQRDIKQFILGMTEIAKTAPASVAESIVLAASQLYVNEGTPSRSGGTMFANHFQIRDEHNPSARFVSWVYEHTRPTGTPLLWHPDSSPEQIVAWARSHGVLKETPYGQPESLQFTNINQAFRPGNVLVIDENNDGKPDELGILVGLEYNNMGNGIQITGFRYITVTDKTEKATVIPVDLRINQGMTRIRGVIDISGYYHDVLKLDRTDVTDWSLFAKQVSAGPEIPIDYDKDIIKFNSKVYKADALVKAILRRGLPKSGNYCSQTVQEAIMEAYADIPGIRRVFGNANANQMDERLESMGWKQSPVPIHGGIAIWEYTSLFPQYGHIGVINEESPGVFKIHSDDPGYYLSSLYTGPGNAKPEFWYYPSNERVPEPEFPAPPASVNAGPPPASQTGESPAAQNQPATAPTQPAVDISPNDPAATVNGNPNRGAAEVAPAEQASSPPLTPVTGFQSRNAGGVVTEIMKDKLASGFGGDCAPTVARALLRANPDHPGIRTMVANGNFGDMATRLQEAGFVESFDGPVHGGVATWAWTYLSSAYGHTGVVDIQADGTVMIRADDEGYDLATIFNQGQVAPVRFWYLPQEGANTPGDHPIDSVADAHQPTAITVAYRTSANGQPQVASVGHLPSTSSMDVVSLGYGLHSLQLVDAQTGQMVCYNCSPSEVNVGRAYKIIVADMLLKAYADKDLKKISIKVPLSLIDPTDTSIQPGETTLWTLLEKMIVEDSSTATNTLVLLLGKQGNLVQRGQHFTALARQYGYNSTYWQSHTNIDTTGDMASSNGTNSQDLIRALKSLLNYKQKGPNDPQEVKRLAASAWSLLKATQFPGNHLQANPNLVLKNDQRATGNDLSIANVGSIRVNGRLYYYSAIPSEGINAGEKVDQRVSRAIEALVRQLQSGGNQYQTLQA